MKQSSFVNAFVTILAKHNVIEHDKALALKKLFEESSQASFIDFLLEEGLFSRGVILNALSEYYRVPAFDVVGHFFERHLVRMFEKGVMLRNVFIPLEVDENIMIVIASDPSNPALLPIIGKSVSYDIQFMVGIGPDICDAVKEFYEESITEVEEDSDLHEENELQQESERIILEDEEE